MSQRGDSENGDYWMMCAAEATLRGGQTPAAKAVGGTREKPSMIFTFTNQGKTCWMIIWV